MSNQKQLNDLVKRISGQSNVLTIPRVYLDLTGDHVSALFLSQCIYWSDKGRGGWFYKSEAEWLEELGLSPYQVRRCRKELEPYIETNLRKANGAPTMHYRVKIDAVTDAIVKKLNNPLSRNSIMESEETSQSDCEETPQSLTETTQETTAKTTHIEAEGRTAILALKILAAASGMVTFPPLEMVRIEQVLALVDKYGEASVTKAMTDECKRWAGTRRKDGSTYRITNLGWIDWAQERLIAETAPAKPRQKKLTQIQLGDGTIVEEMV